jgi:predicted MPP superfamily phosphohydrolase
MFSRPIWLISLVLATSLFIALGLFWRSGSDLEITHHDLRGPSQASSFRVVQLSDLHLQRFGKAEQVIVAQMQALKPDLVVLTGDAIDHADALPVLKDFLAGLGSIPVVAVPGNWEHWSGVDFPALIALFANRSNGRFLLNERVLFTSGERTIHLIGLDDFTAGQPDARLLSAAASDDVSVLVQHSPGFFDAPEVNRRMRQQRFSLCLSGHTHGGQITVGGWAPFRPVGSGRFVAGFYDVPGCRLYVSKGLGTSILPLRWGAAPEIAVFDL